MMNLTQVLLAAALGLSACSADPAKSFHIVNQNCTARFDCALTIRADWFPDQPMMQPLKNPWGNMTGWVNTFTYGPDSEAMLDDGSGRCLAWVGPRGGGALTVQSPCRNDTSVFVMAPGDPPGCLMAMRWSKDSGTFLKIKPTPQVGDLLVGVNETDLKTEDCMWFTPKAKTNSDVDVVDTLMV